MAQRPALRASSFPNSTSVNEIGGITCEAVYGYRLVFPGDDSKRELKKQTELALDRGPAKCSRSTPTKFPDNVISFIRSYTLAKFELWPTIAIRSRHAFFKSRTTFQSGPTKKRVRRGSQYL